MEERKVVTLEDLKKLAEGEIVELPSFVGDGTICVRLRRPSLIQMVKAGKIPNTLLEDANTLFASGAAGVARKGDSSKDPEALSKMCELLEVVCEAAFVEPTYKEIKNAGIELTDSQLLAVFAYTQNGVESLKSFH